MRIKNNQYKYNPAELANFKLPPRGKSTEIWAQAHCQAISIELGELYISNASLLRFQCENFHFGDGCEM
jgi:hypothetical protein